MKKIILVICLVLLSVCLMSQKVKYHTDSKKAIKKFEKSQQLYDNRNYSGALKLLNEVIYEDDNFLEAHLFKAELSDFLGDEASCYQSYEKVFEIDSSYDYFIAYQLAFISYQRGKYEQAKSYIDFFISNVEVKKYDHKYQVLRLRDNIYFSDNAVKNPVDFNPINLGNGVNTAYDEYWPSLSIDDSVLVFTRMHPFAPNQNSKLRENLQEDLFVAYLDRRTGRYINARPLPGNVNTRLNEGAQCISADGKTCIITCCGRPDGVGRCDLYIMFLVDGKWTEPKNMRSVNTPYWESNPSLSADGRYLYFASGGRPGGQGKIDIWVVEIDKYGNAIGQAKNLGATINTPYNESSPFIHPDGKTLYFASDGHLGLGNYDLFYSKLDENGEWSTPVNLGYPINSSGEERSLIVSAKGDIAMFASSADKGNLDLYYFNLPEEAKPTAVTYVKGFVYDINTNKRLAAKCELLDLQTEKKVAEINTDENSGEYLISLPTGKNYAFNVAKKGYLFYSENFSLQNFDNSNSAYNMNIPLSPISKGVTVILKNIFFDFNSFDLLSDSYVELNKVVEYMVINPKIRIEIGGHTDNVGSKQFNKSLSESRAKSVLDYIVSKGIDSSRLTYKGYDFSTPIASNDSEEGRAQNRRTEFKVISID